MRWTAALPVAAVFLCLCAATSCPAAALMTGVQQLQVGLFPTRPNMAGTPPTLGWSFAPQRPIWVQELGFFDDGQDGLKEAHQVGIWSSRGRLLRKVTVQSSELVGSYRYERIAPLRLKRGETYVIGATVASPARVVIAQSISPMAHEETWIPWPEYPWGDGPWEHDRFPFYQNVAARLVRIDPTIIPKSVALAGEDPNADPMGSLSPGRLSFPAGVSPPYGNLEGYTLVANFRFSLAIRSQAACDHLTVRPAGLMAGSAPVPEPSGLSILGLVVWALLRRRNPADANRPEPGQ